MRAVRAAILLAVVAAAVFANSFRNPLLLDDVDTIADNPQIRQLDVNVLKPERELPTAGRPLVNLTFALNYAVSGAAPAAYHATNLALHVLCAMAMLLLIRRLFGLDRVPALLRDHRDGVALAAALVWVVHPLNSEVVNYVTQRTESLMALGYLLAVYCSVRALTSPGRTWAWLAVVSCLAGSLCKETIATAPLVVMALDRLLVFSAWREAWRRRWPLYLGLSSCWILLGALQAASPRPYSAGFGAGITPWTYALNQAVMIAHYLRLVVWPTGLVVFYGRPVALTVGEVVPQAIVVLALLTATVVAWRRWPLVAAAGVWVFCTLGPTSSVLPIATEVGAERRMYLPLMALTTLAAGAIWRAARNPVTSTLVTGALVAMLGVTTFARNREYADTGRLAELTLERWPSGMARLLVAERLVESGRSGEAMPLLRAAVADEPRAHYQLGMQLFNGNQLAQAADELQAFARLEPMHRAVPDALATAAVALGRLERWDQAANLATEALAKAPDQPAALAVAAEAHFRASRFADAVPAYRRYLALRINDVQATTNLAISLMATGQVDDGLAAFRRAADLAPGQWQLRRNLAVALLDAGRPAEAITEIQRAIQLQPDAGGNYTVLGQALARQGRAADAAAAFGRALQLDPNDAEAREAMGKR